MDNAKTKELYEAIDAKCEEITLILREAGLDGHITLAMKHAAYDAFYRSVINADGFTLRGAVPHHARNTLQIGYVSYTLKKD